MAYTASRKGRCNRCGRPYKPGELIATVTNGDVAMVMHATCQQAPPAPADCDFLRDLRSAMHDAAQAARGAA